MKRLAQIGIGILAVVILLSCVVDCHTVSALLSENPPSVANDTGTKSVILNTGDRALFGRYEQEPIMWDVAEITDEEAVLVSHNILCFKAYCAGDDSFPCGRSSSDFSTLVTWLNAEEPTVSYKAALPDGDHVYQSINPYADEPGFLCDTNFSRAEKNCLCSAVFIPSKTQFSTYFSKTARVKTPTAGAIKADRSSFFRSTEVGAWYWTSTENPQSRMSVVATTAYGSFYKSLAYDGTMGVVPAVKICKAVTCAASGDGTANAPYIVKGVDE